MELKIEICTYLEAKFNLKLEVVLKQLDVLSLRVELKLRHWPSTTDSFIARLTNQRPVFFHSSYLFLIGQWGTILASDWSAWAISRS